AWTRQNGATLKASLGGGSPFDVISTDGIALTRIVGGTQSDSLNVQDDTASNVQGSIDGNSVDLKSGIVVLVAATSGTFANFDSVVAFDGLGASQMSYSEAGFTLSSPTSFTRNDAISPALSGS